MLHCHYFHKAFYCCSKYPFPLFFVNPDQKIDKFMKERTRFLQESVRGGFHFSGAHKEYQRLGDKKR